MFEGEAAHLVVVDALGLLVEVVGHEVEVLAGEIDGAAVGEVAAVGKAHAQHGVARLEQGKVHGGVGLRAGMGLHIGVVGAKEFLGALAGQILDLIDELTAAIVALAGIALGVLVRQVGTHRLHDGGADEVFRSDQFNVRLLTLQFALHGGINFRVGLLDGRVFQHGSRLLVIRFLHITR